MHTGLLIASPDIPYCAQRLDAVLKTQSLSFLDFLAGLLWLCRFCAPSIDQTAVYKVVREYLGSDRVEMYEMQCLAHNLATRL